MTFQSEQELEELLIAQLQNQGYSIYMLFNSIIQGVKVNEVY